MCEARHLVTIWVIAWLCILGDGVRIRTNCLQLLPRNFWNQTVYNETSQRLQLNFDYSSNTKLSKCLNLTRSDTKYKLQLFRVSDYESQQCCDLQCSSANMFKEEDVGQLVIGDKANNVSFHYVKGKYFLRLVRVVSEGGGTCEEGSFSSCSSMCSPMLTMGGISGDKDTCSDLPDTNSTNIMEVVINQSFQDTVEPSQCQFEIEMTFPVCHVIHSYSTANVSSVEVPLNFSCSELDILDWDNFQVSLVNNDSIMIIRVQYIWLPNLLAYTQKQ